MSGLSETLGPLSPTLSPSSVLQRSSVRSEGLLAKSRSFWRDDLAFLVFTLGLSSLDGFEINSWS